jgi:GNAT superfamily N-acetyltransferase
MALDIVEADPQGADARSLLHEAAVEARALYPELHAPDAPWPTNAPTPPRGVYLLGYVDGKVVASGALRPLDDAVVEVRRMYVAVSARRAGCATQMLRALETTAAGMGYSTLRLETGYRQLPAIALYLRSGYRRIDPFGPYADDPTSVCFEKHIGGASASLA